MKQVENKDSNFFDDAFGMPICDECFEKAKKTGCLRLILNPKAYVVPISAEVYEDIMRPITWWSRFRFFVFWAMPRILWHGVSVDRLCKEHGI